MRSLDHGHVAGRRRTIAETILPKAVYAVRTLWRLAKGSVLAYAKDKASAFAAAIAYHTLFSIFPLSLFVIGVAGYFMTKGQRNALANDLAQALGSGTSANIERQIRLVTNGRAGLSIFGLLLALWSASAIFGSLRTGLNAVWKYERRRSWITAKAQDLLAVFGFGLLLAVAFAATFVLTLLSQIAHHLLGTRLGDLATLFFSLLFFLLPFAVSFFTFGVLYIVTSPPSVHWRRVWPGALVGAIGFQALNLGFSVYVRSYGHFDKIYGSLGAVIAFLFYAYLLSSLMLFGGEVAHQYALLRPRPQEPAAPVPPAPRTPAADGSVIFFPRPRR